MRKEKLRKVRILFYLTGYFMKPLKMASNHFFSSIGLFVHKTFFYFASMFTAQFLFFDVRMTQEISKEEIENNKQLGIANYNISFKKISIF